MFHFCVVGSHSHVCIRSLICIQTSYVYLCVCICIHIFVLICICSFIVDFTFMAMMLFAFTCCMLFICICVGIHIYVCMCLPFSCCCSYTLCLFVYSFVVVVVFLCLCICIYTCIHFPRCTSFIPEVSDVVPFWLVYAIILKKISHNQKQTTLEPLGRYDHTHAKAVLSSAFWGRAECTRP